MQYFFYSLVSLLLITSAKVAVAEGSLQSQAARQYPEEFVQSFNQECIETSLAEGLGEAEAKRLCDCTISEFERQYTLEEFEQLTAAAATDSASEMVLVEAGQFCFEQILYAE